MSEAPDAVKKTTKPVPALPRLRRQDKNPAKVTSTQTIVERISRAISERRLPPGTKLAEEALGDIFGVSRTKVREALFQLAKEKLIELQPARGAFVAQPSVREAREIFEARRVIERGVTENFIRVATPEQLAQLRTHVTREREAVAAHDVPASAKLSGEFHLLMAEMAGNAVLVDLLRELISRTSLIIVLYESSFPASCSCEDHEQLLTHMESGDAKGAAQAMVQHLERIERNLHLREAAPGTTDVRTALTGV